MRLRRSAAAAAAACSAAGSCSSLLRLSAALLPSIYLLIAATAHISAAFSSDIGNSAVEGGSGGRGAAVLTSGTALGGAAADGVRRSHGVHDIGLERASGRLSSHGRRLRQSTSCGSYDACTEAADAAQAGAPSSVYISKLRLIALYQQLRVSIDGT